MIKSISVAAVLSLLSSAAFAGPMWESFGIAAKQSDAPKIVAATDKFMTSAEGKAFPGKLIMMTNVANGADPTTHSWVAIYNSTADAERWGASLENAKSWTDFMNAVSPITTPTVDARYALVKSWGKADDATSVWHGHMIKSSDPAKTAAALDKWFNSSKGKTFPGEAYLSAPIAAGPTPMTHLISVGFKSEADMETWSDSLQGNADYVAFINEFLATTEYLGATLSREVKEWGSPMNEATN